MDDLSTHPLAIALSCAVPLRIAEYEARGGPSPADLDRVRGHAGLIAERADIVLYRGKKKGEAAAVFAALADGLAVMAFCPGGVRFAGSHYEAKGRPCPTT